MERENVIKQKSFDFALKIIEFTELLQEKRKFLVADQLLKSGTSIGANVCEAQSAESRADFIHKMKVAHKESEETDYWLLLCQYSKNYPFDEKLYNDNKELLKILNSIISSSKKHK